MKSKEQKRKEAIERLEREPRTLTMGCDLHATWQKRQAEAARLREVFGFPVGKTESQS